MIHAHATHHETSNTAYTMVQERLGKEEITDAVALTIASWWQSASGDGLPFARLASTRKVNYHDLSEAIAKVYPYAEEEDKVALDMLSTWALSKQMGRLP